MTEPDVMAKSFVSKTSIFPRVSTCVSDSLYKGLAFLWSSAVTPSEQCQLFMRRVGRLARDGPELYVRGSWMSTLTFPAHGILYFAHLTWCFRGRMVTFAIQLTIVCNFQPVLFFSTVFPRFHHLPQHICFVITLERIYLHRLEKVCLKYLFTCAW